MQCTDCGRANRPHASYCAWCGAPLPSPASDAPVATERDSRMQSGAVTRKLDPTEMPRDDSPLEAGRILEGRYEIDDMIEETPDSRVYRALDRLRCPSCGHVREDSEFQTYCEVCGVLLEEPAPVTVIEYFFRRPETHDGHFQRAGRDYYVVAEPISGLEAQEQPEALRLSFASATHPGHNYDHNEDAVDARVYSDQRGTTLGFFAVADGVGGQQAGEIASGLALETTWSELYQEVWQAAIQGGPLDAQACQDAVAAAISAANQAIYNERTTRASDMSTTITLALVVGRMACIGNVGDSRTYLLDDNGFQRITRDHSLVQRMIDAGQLEPHEIYTHPRRNVIYESVGDRPHLEADTFSVELSPDARLVLCSDGLWEMVREEGIEEVLMAEPDPQRAVEQLIQNALTAGGADNISVVIVQVSV